MAPCPINCEFSQWGTWYPCSITCGDKGAGTQERHRHIAQEAKYGGRKCPSKSQLTEQRTCRHEDMSKEELEGEPKEGVINHCPIDCEYEKWSAWREPCPKCYGGSSNMPRHYVINYQQKRQRDIKQFHNYGGKPCKFPVPTEERTCGELYGDDLKECKTKADSVGHYSDWETWQDCKGECGKPGTRIRIRHCNEGEKEGQEKCPKDQSPQEEEKCVTFCPSSK